MKNVEYKATNPWELSEFLHKERRRYYSANDMCLPGFEAPVPFSLGLRSFWFKSDVVNLAAIDIYNDE